MPVSMAIDSQSKALTDAIWMLEDKEELSDEELITAVLVMWKNPSNPRTYRSLWKKVVRKGWLERMMNDFE